MAPRDTLVFVHTSDEFYGADRILLDLLTAVPDSVPVEVWLPTDLPHPPRPLCDELRSQGVRVRHLSLPILRRAYQNPRGLLGLAARTLTLTGRLLTTRPRGVYATTSAAFIALPAARLTGVPVRVGHVQELWSRVETRVIGALALHAQRLLTISGAVRDQLPARLQGRAKLALNSTAEPSWVEPLQGRTGPLTFTVASRWNGWKGHRTLLAAWEQAGCPGRLVIYGGPPASGESVDVPALVAGLSDPSSVEIVGEVADAADRFSEADVVIMPSDSPEPFGLVAIEAFARARPVIASNGGGLADIVTDGDDGWLFEPRDVAGLAAILSGLTREQVTEAGDHARASYLARFTRQRFSDDWRHIVFGTR